MEAWETHAWFAEFLDAYNRHDAGEIRTFLADDVRRAHLPRGADAWLADLDERFHGFPDWRWRRIQVVVEDDRVAAHVRGSGTHTGSYRGVAPTGRHANVAEFWMLRLVGDRIVESTGSGDHELFARLRGED